MKPLQLFVAVAISLLAFPAWSADYEFNINYNGNGVADLAPNSQDPRLTVLLPGDNFTWAINAQDNFQWSVLNGGDVFPMMAFGVSESAYRIGNFVFQLFNDGQEVFSVQESSSLQSQVHMGTNTISLPTGLVFDSWKLNYSLISAIEVITVEDPDNPGSYIEVQGSSITSSPYTLLPIFGTLDTNTSTTTIYAAAVPEPESYAMLLAGFCIIGALARSSKNKQA